MNEEAEPGQWETDGTYIVSKGEGVVAKIFREDAIPLIKAAPDLLEALETLLDIFERVTHGYPPGAELEFAARDKAVAAIAKAKGGAE